MERLEVSFVTWITRYLLAEGRIEIILEFAEIFYQRCIRGKEMKNVRDSYTTIRSNKIDRGRFQDQRYRKEKWPAPRREKDLIHLPTRIVEKKVLRARLILSSSSFPRAILHRNLDPPCQRGKVEHRVLDLFTSYSLCRENERWFFLIISRILAKVLFPKSGKFF